MKNTWTKMLTLCSVWALVALGASAAPFMAVNDSATSHDYLTLNYYINEPGEYETLTLDLYPDEAGTVEKAELWSNLNRRDYATLAAQDAVSNPSPSPTGTTYFVGYAMTNVSAGKWRIQLPVNKTGAYRVTARWKVAGDPNWRWVGGRDMAVMVSPKKSRDVILYETMVNVINANGDTFATRSTFEDMTNTTKHANLDYFESLGVNTLWIQPIHPIGSNPCPDIGPGEGPGSPYSIQNMWEVAPHHSLGNTRESSMTAFTNFAAAAKARGIDFFFDIIFNHTSWDAEVGRNPTNPAVANVPPTAMIKDLRPQWYSRFTGTFLCDGTAYTQTPFQFQLPAQNAGQLGPAPAERNDFGKWPDVADLFWGVYPALLDPQTDTDAYWDTTQVGANVEAMVEYFAYFGQYWIEKSGGTLGGFRSDYAQGLPPQAWEYFVNKIRQTKWDFIFMAESLDGGNVSKRAGRHMDIINQNWVWQVLDNAGTASGFRGIIDANKTSYGFAGIMRGIVNHDQNAPNDKWYTFSRYAVGAVIDGAPQIYQGQEIGYTNGYGFSQFREQYGRYIPHIFKWHNMQTLWNNQDTVLRDAYGRVNKGRMRNVASRLHDQWYLDQQVGGAHQDIFAVLKYENFGWDPSDQNVVLSFVNLKPWTTQAGSFKVSDVSAIYINPTKRYNVRNLASSDPDAYLWGTNGILGSEIIANGIYVSMSSDGINNPDTAFVQMLKLEQNNAQEVEPYVTWTPTNATGCNTIAIRYRKADSPLGAGPVYIHIGHDGWLDVQTPAPQMANDGTAWVYYANPMPGTTNINFVFNNGSTWDNNGGQDWTITLASPCSGVVQQVVWTDPATVTACEPVTIYYNAATRPLASANPVRIYIGRNGWTNIVEPEPAMTLASNSVWRYTYTPTTGTETINFVFNDGAATNKVWDNNGGLDWSMIIAGCGEYIPPPDFAITSPTGTITVANTFSNYILEGRAVGMTGTIGWTNSLNGSSSTIPAAHPWVIPQVPLAVGSNIITVRGSKTLSATTNTVGADSADNYGGTWASGSNQGTGFGAWSFNHNQGSGAAGVFIGNPTLAGISGLGTNGFGFYANPAGSGANAEAARSFSSPLANGESFKIDLGLNWDSNVPNSNRGLVLMAGATELVVINMGNSQTVTVNSATMFSNYGANAMPITFTYVSNGSVRVTATGRDGVETYNQVLAVSNDAPSGFKFYYNAINANEPNREMYFDNMALLQPVAGGTTTTSDTVVIVRQASANPDSNGNGIPDDEEMLIFGQLVAGDGDEDEDGMTNYEEYIAATDPMSAASIFEFNNALMSTNNTGRVMVQWYGRPQRLYQVVASRQGVAGPYTNNVGSPRSTEGGQSYNLTIEDTDSGNFTNTFYRLKVWRNN